MSIVVIGLNHRTVPVGLLERFSVGGAALDKLLHDLCARSNLTEAVVLSTCNRTEVYAQAERFHGAYSDIRDALCLLGDATESEIADHLYSDHDDGAVAHLLAVACGLESDVLGETEILGQVKAAWERARELGASRSALNLLFRHAVEAGKRARTETGISRGTSSVSHAAVELAAEHLGELRARSVLVLGAGVMGDGVARALALAGAQVVVANRTEERAVAVAEQHGGVAVAAANLADALPGVDVVVASAPGLTPELLGDRSARELLVIDIGVPRTVPQSVTDAPGVTLLDLDDLQRWADRGRRERETEVRAVRRVIVDELGRFNEAVIGRQAAPLIAQLHELGGTIRGGELDRFRGRLGGLSPDELDVVEQLTRAIVAKMLHPMSERLREHAGTPRGERNAAALRDVFDLS